MMATNWLISELPTSVNRSCKGSTGLKPRSMTPFGLTADRRAVAPGPFIASKAHPSAEERRQHSDLAQIGAVSWSVQPLSNRYLTPVWKDARRWREEGAVFRQRPRTRNSDSQALRTIRFSRQARGIEPTIVAAPG